MTEPVQLPIACTLTGASLEERAAWLRRLGEAALVDGARHGERLELRFQPEAEPDVRQLIRAERECCPFLVFEVEPGDAEIRVGISGPAEAGPVLDAMLLALRGA
jgi:hypothetical protein